MTRLPLLVVLVALGGCGTGPSAAEGADAPAPLTIPLPAATFTARSQVWAPEFYGLLAYRLDVHLLGNAAACDDPEGLVQRPGVPWFTVTVLFPAVGVECPLFDPWTHDHPDGCIAFASEHLIDEAGNHFRSPATSGTVRISRGDGTRLIGTVRGLFPGGFYNVFHCQESYEGSPGAETFGSCECDEPEGRRTCEMSRSADPCCDDALGLTEVEIPFEADACEAAADCRVGPCPSLAIDSACEPSAAPIHDCGEACNGFERVCHSCSGCPADDADCLEAANCDVSDCLEVCRSVMAHDPTFATSFRCFAASGTCDSWLSCMRSCGDD